MDQTRRDDAALAAAAATPDRFREVFDGHYAAIHRYLARRVGGDRADDLAAETFAVAFARRGSYRPSGHGPGPWLFGIAANLLRRDRRTEERMWRAYARTGIDPTADEQEEAIERTSASADAARVAGALGALRRQDREALLLFAWAELTYEEVAEALGIPVGTVRSRISRARGVLRACLEAPGPSTSATTGGVL